MIHRFVGRPAQTDTSVQLAVVVKEYIWYQVGASLKKESNWWIRNFCLGVCFPIWQKNQNFKMKPERLSQYIICINICIQKLPLHTHCYKLTAVIQYANFCIPQSHYILNGFARHTKPCQRRLNELKNHSTVRVWMTPLATTELGRRTSFIPACFMPISHNRFALRNRRISPGPKAPQYWNSPLVIFCFFFFCKTSKLA